MNIHSMAVEIRLYTEKNKKLQPFPREFSLIIRLVMISLKTADRF